MATLLPKISKNIPW